MEYQRLFIALPLPPSLHAVVNTYQEKLQPLHPKFHWTPSRRLHLTLLFLGTQPTTCIPTWRSRLDTIASLTAPLALQLGQLGAFPTPSQPHVIWLGMAGQSLAGLHTLANQLSQHHPSQKPFIPHITLGRHHGRGATEALTQSSSAHGACWQAKEMTLFSSNQPKPGKLFYTALHTSKFSL
ncbi:RNA 2',3'-cyclic phosphodiesterase [Magnetococcus sp. PR-3]|uniref:RNA 2',3'-cyclic phosphodiesterase n=1 Tax=Magnetococcus sp. PR-3 TaxID=3120355 RepID=UPI002FCE24C9